MCSGTRLSNYIDKYEQNNTFVAGNRHSYLVKLSSVLNNAGFSLYDAVSECVRRYGSADFPAAEVETTVNDIYRRYSASHGSCAFRPDGTSSVPKSAKSAKSATPFPKMAQKDAEYGECDDIELDNTLLPCFDENIYDHLPPLLTDILKCAYSRTDRDILLISSLTLLSSVSPGVKGSLGEHDYTPAFYSIITGGSGSGKGRIAALQRMLEPWQQYIYDNSRHQVEEYEELQEAYDNYKMHKRQKQTSKQPLGPAPSKPKVVKQRNLALTGNVTQARLVELLEELRRRGIRCAVGSSGCRENVDFVLSNCGITDYFSCIVSGDRVTRCKPDPEIYLLAAEGLRLSSAECLVFEDARVGITAARRAGAGRIVALATTLPRHTLATQTEADVVIDDFASITDLNTLLL